MSTDPVQLPDLVAALPHEGDYDAVYAEVMKTARGRWFLTEYSARNRDADTQALIGAIARVEAAIRDDPPASIAGALARELGDLTTAIQRIEEAIAAGGILARDGFPAAECIQDIAFTLRGGKVDAAMCGALEAASRQLADVFARNDAAMERAQGAIAVLRELAGRIDAIVAGAHAGAGMAAEATSALSGSNREGAAMDAVLGEAPSATRAEADIFDDDQFAAQVGVLAASLSEPAIDREEKAAASIGEPVADADPYLFSEPLPGELAGNEDTTIDEATGEESINKKLPSTEILEEQELDDSASTAGSLREKSAGQGALFGHEFIAPAGLDPQRPAAPNDIALAQRGGDPASKRLHDTAKAPDMDAARASIAEESDIDSILEPESVPRALPDSQAMAGPEEDPGDLFEPAAPPSASPASSTGELALEAPSTVAANAPPIETDAPAVIAEAHEQGAASEDKGQAEVDSSSSAAHQISPPESPTLTAPDQLTAEPHLPQPRDAAVMPPARTIPYAATGEPRDPLAALRALSEEELIALFS